MQRDPFPLLPLILSFSDLHNRNHSHTDSSFHFYSFPYSNFKGFWSWKSRKGKFGKLLAVVDLSASGLFWIQIKWGRRKRKNRAPPISIFYYLKFGLQLLGRIAGFHFPNFVEWNQTFKKIIFSSIIWRHVSVALNLRVNLKHVMMATQYYYCHHYCCCHIYANCHYFFFWPSQHRGGRLGRVYPTKT